MRIALALIALAWVESAALTAQERVLESIVPALAYGGRCSSTVELQNLSERPVTVEVEAHRESGALVALAGPPGNTLRLAPHDRSSRKLEIAEETLGAWVKVRERIGGPALAPAVAVSAATECIAGNQLRTAAREVAFPTRNPWFAGDVSEIPGDMMALINTSERAARATLCYSAGGLYSVPAGARGASELQPLCSSAFDVQIPPFGSRQFPVAREGSSHFSLKTQGDSIVLQMLRPVDAAVKIYAVDSTIKFGAEVPGR